MVTVRLNVRFITAKKKTYRQIYEFWQPKLHCVRIWKTILHSTTYHKYCYNDLKKIPQTAPEPTTRPNSPKYQRLSKRQSSTQICCFLCDEPDDVANMHQVLTTNLNKKVKEAAEYLKKFELLSKVSTGDLIANEARYHLSCLNKLYKEHEQEKKTQNLSKRKKMIQFSPSW